MSAHRRLTTIAAFVLALAIALLPGVATAQEDAAGPRWIQLLWDAPSVDAGTLVEHAAEHSDLRITTIARWDNADQRWLLWRPGVPAFVNAFTELQQGSIYWFSATYVGSGTAGVRHPVARRTGACHRGGAQPGGLRPRSVPSLDRRRRRRLRHAQGSADPRRGRDSDGRRALQSLRWAMGQPLRRTGVHRRRRRPRCGSHGAARRGWDSGAWAWSPERRRAFANDLEHRFALLAVSASSNRSKGARDPAEWMPPEASSHCLYATYWRDTKVAWALTFDQAEVDALEIALATCKD